LYLAVDPNVPQRFDEFSVGTPVVGIVQKVFNDFLKLSLSPFATGTIHALQLSNSDRSIASHPLSQTYSVGDRIGGWVTGFNDSFVLVSAIDPSREESVHFGKVLHVKPGDFAEVVIGMNDKRRLDVFDVSDEFEFDPLRSLKPGAVIDVCFVPGTTNVSTRQSAFDGNFPEFTPEVGQVLKGYVCFHAAGSLLVRIGRGVTGRLPFGKVADTYLKTATDLFPIGSVVTVKIEGMDNAHIDLTARTSDLSGRILTFDDLKQGEVVNGFITGVSAHGVFVSLRDYQKVSGLVHRSNLENQDPTSWAAFMNTKVRVRIDAIDREKRRPCFKLVELEERPESEVSETESESDAESEPELNEIDLDFDEGQEGGQDREQIRKKLQLTEEQISKLEAQQLNPSAPQTKEEFVSLLMAAPNSSYLWVKFIEFHFANGDVEGAKATAERALERLPIGDRAEKTNVWIALINLTVLTVTDNDFVAECKPLVLRAAASTDNKRIWSHFAVFTSANRPSHAAEAWKLALKKCKGSLKIWIKYFEVLMKEEKFDEAMQEFKRASESCQAQKASKQWKLQQRFAVLQFKFRNVELGRTMFDSLVQNRPNQFDFWCSYADAEAAHGDVDHARAVFDRIAKLKLSPARMRTILKKWLEFEKEHGDDPKRKAYIKQIALEYTAQRQSE
jgi:rRNA biogenesis protein RRP5